MRKLLRSLQITGAAPASVKDPVWKYQWVRQNEPETFDRIHKWLDVKEFLILKCTGEFVMTHDSAFGTLLYDPRPGQKQFSKALCSMFGVDPGHLPRLVRTTEQVGTLTEQAAAQLGLPAGTPVFGGGGDASLIGVGAGAAAPGSTHIYSGTSGWVSTVVKKRAVDVPQMIASIVGADETSFNYFAELETAGKCLEWVRDHLALDEINLYLQQATVDSSPEAVNKSLYDFMLEEVKSVPAGSNGVIFTPWLHGNRCPFEDPNATGMFFGIRLDTGKRDLINAVIEGICYHLRWQLEASEKKITTSDTVRFVGGGALAPLTCQTLSDVLGRPVETVRDPQNVGALGAAVTVAVGLGLLDSIEDADQVDASAITLLSMSFMVMFILLAAPSSWVIDKYGFRTSLVVGALLTVVFSIVRAAFATNFTVVLIAQFLIAAGQPFLLNISTKAPANWFPIGERSTAAGILTMAQYVGFAIPMVASPLLVESFGIPQMLWTYAIIAAVSGVVSIAFTRERPATPPPGPVAADESFSFRGVGKLLKNGPYVLVLTVCFISMGIFNTILTEVEAILMPLGLDSEQAGLVGAAFVVAGIIGAVVLPMLSDKLKTRRPFSITAIAILIPSYLVFTFVDSFPILLAVAVIAGFSIMGVAPILFQYGSEVAYPAPEGTSLGMVLMMGQISGILFLSLFGVLNSATGGPMWPMLMIVALTVISLPVVMRMKESGVGDKEFGGEVS